MMLESITYQNFRNIDFKNIKADKINVIYGKNASGKTNMLEGIFMLLNGHSFKKSNIIIQKYNSDRTILKGKVNKSNIEICVDKKGKTIKTDGKKTNILELKTKFPSIIYSIDSFLSFKNKEYLFSLIDRNSFIENSKIASYLMEYKKSVKIKRGILTKSLKPDENMLRIINKKIDEIADEIAQQRIESVQYINENINDTLKKFTDKKIKITYRRENRKKYITQLEINKRRILTSINKDTIEILFDGKNIFNYSSVGEKKVILFSLIVTVVKHYNNYTTPVMLIDDIEGDLDSDSKNAVFKILISLPNQLFLTTLGEYLYNDANIIRL